MEPSDEPTLDLTRVEMLRRLDEGLLQELATTYRKESVGRMKALRSALAAGDAQATMRAAHVLRGASANIGAPKMAAICKRVELAAEAGDLGAAGIAFEGVATHLPLLIQELDGIA